MWPASPPLLKLLHCYELARTLIFAVLDVKLSGLERNSLGIAALLASKRTPFVFLTGMRVDDVHAKQFPQAPVVEKPYDAVTLLGAVRRALGIG